MTTTRRCLTASLLFAFVAGCGEPGTLEDTARTALALDVCSETVPANRNVDGIPSYAQCDLTMESAIWSNNGVDTSTTSLGSDWVQTQRSGGYQCTELAYRYMRFRWDVSYRSGNAQEWCAGALPSNLVKSTTPVHGDLMVFAGGVCGADASTGHIAVVDTVEAARAAVTIVEENRAGRRSADQSCATCFLHAVENDGSAGGAAGAGGMSGAGGSGIAGMAGSASGGMGVAGSAPASGGTAGAGSSAGGAGISGSPSTGGSAGTSTATGGAPSSTGGGSGAPTSGSAGQSGSGAAPPGATDSESALDEDAGCSMSPRGSRHASPVASALGLLVAMLGRRRRPRVTR